MTHEQKVIEDIKNELYGSPKLVSISANALKIIAKQLYKEKEHFIFELIQNADDNTYEDGISPSLSFTIKELLLNNKKSVCLLVENNEVGFLENNVRAICNVNESTKIGQRRCTGEKGIGFKSIFAVTECPYIFSNRYAFCIPPDMEIDGEKLPYIVPKWVNVVPDFIKENTTFVLPLKEDCIHGIIQELVSFRPETILFLRQLRTIKFSIELEDNHCEYIVTRSEVSKSKIVTLRHESCDSPSSKTEEELSYLYWSQEISKPVDLFEETRDKITDVTLTLAIPLAPIEENRTGSLYAYLPVHNGTGFPFIINSDFVLTANRGEVVENDWNKWIRSQIPDTFADALQYGMNSAALSRQQKIYLFSRIPEDSSYDFLCANDNDCIERIYSILENYKCVLLFQSKQVSCPSQCYFLPPHSNILLKLGWKPSYMEENKEEYMFVADDLRPYEGICKRLGISRAHMSIVSCLSPSFLKHCSNQQLLELYDYLMDKEIEINHTPIIPVENGEDILFVSGSDVMLFWEKDPNKTLPGFGKKPQVHYVLNDLKRAIFKTFDNKVSDLEPETKDKTRKELKERFESFFSVSDFSINAYCKKLNEILDSEIDVTIRDFLDISFFLLDNNVLPSCFLTNKGIIRYEELGGIDRLWDVRDWRSRPEITATFLVVSEDYDPEFGWQNIWKEENQRSHFVYLKGYKKTYQDKLLESETSKKIEKRKIFRYPVFYVERVDGVWGREGVCDLEEYREKIKNKNGRLTDKCFTVFVPFNDALKTDTKALNSFLQSLLYWSETIQLSNEGDYDEASLIERGLLRKEHLYNGTKYAADDLFLPSPIVKFLCGIDSIPSSHGMSRPTFLWMPHRDIKSTLGEDARYCSLSFSDKIANALGIHSQLNIESLLSFIQLKAEAREPVALETAQKIYTKLLEIYKEDLSAKKSLADFFSNNDSIFFPNSNKVWYKRNDCILNKAEITEFEFQYISEVYSDNNFVMEFFRDVIEIEEKVPESYYLDYWIMCQNENKIISPNNVRIFYKAIYEVYSRRNYIPSCQEKWWEFRQISKPLSDHGKFAKREDAFLSDSPALESCYRTHNDVSFVPSFGELNLQELSAFYEEFGVERLSNSIVIKLIDNYSGFSQYKDITRDYLTHSCLAMIAAWIWENIIYSREESLEKLTLLKSSRLIDYPRKQHVSCILANKHKADFTEIVYHDVDNNIFLCYRGDDEEFKIEFSIAIAQFVLGGINRDLIDGFASEIEHYLQSTNTKRIERRGWTIPEPYRVDSLSLPDNETVQTSRGSLDEEDNSSLKSSVCSKAASSESVPSDSGTALKISEDSSQEKEIHSTESSHHVSNSSSCNEDSRYPSRESGTSDDRYNDSSMPNKHFKDGGVSKGESDSESGSEKNRLNNNQPKASWSPEQHHVSTHTASVMNKIAERIFNRNSREQMPPVAEDDYDQDDCIPSPVNYKKLIEDELQKSASSVHMIEQMEDLQRKAMESSKYSFEWFKSLLEMECTNSCEANAKSRVISIEFSKVEREKCSQRILVLGQPNRYIPQFMEDLADIALYLHIGESQRKIGIEVSNIKSYTLRVKLKDPDALNDIDLSEVDCASIQTKSPVFLLEELRNQFAKLEFPDEYDMQANLCEDIEFIFGPPGTGKTTYLAREVLSPLMEDNKDIKVLVLTPTNKAADVLVRKIMEMDEYADNQSYEKWLIRFGTTGDEIIEKSPVFKDKTFDIRSFRKNVTVTTIARFPYDFFMPQGSRLHLQALNWDYIVIDEASMIPLVNIIYPLYKKTPQKFIVAGDPFQIQPISTVDMWKDENIYSLVGLNSFKNPRTKPHQYAVKNLSTQYRSIPEIGNLFSQFAYDGVLEHNRTSASRIPLNFGNDLDIQSINILKYPVSRYESIYRSKRLQHRSAYQIYSALFTCEFVSYLSNVIAKNNPGQRIKIGVIAPYRAQADLLEKLVASQKTPKEVNVQVGTIHGFQGDECDIIFAVFNAPPRITQSTEMFLNKRNIINVSISRARDYLFIVMPDDETENVSNLFCIKHVERIIKQSQSWTEFLTPDLELKMFGDSRYLENNAFSTSHQNVNVYGKPEKIYEVRTEDNAVDIQIHNEERDMP